MDNLRFRRIAIIGTGRVAQVLALSLAPYSDHRLMLWGRSPEKLAAAASRTGAAVASFAEAASGDVIAIAVSDDAITAALAEAARLEGFLMCPEGAATYAAYKQALADGRIRRDKRAVLFNCATGLKYPLPPSRQTLDRHKLIDYAAL